jgi:hypothetical protein
MARIAQVKRFAGVLALAPVLFAAPPAPVPYKCVFNHELLIAAQVKDNSPAHFASFIDKLADTDVDAVLCCPGMWRTNLYPSKIDVAWRRYTPGQPVSKFRPFDYIMAYIHGGGDPVQETLDACRRARKAFFINYRMNDQHYIDDLAWPTHNFIWREHPEYWLADAAENPVRSDRCRLLNYMLPPVRDYYFSILEELATSYDIDGLELDFQRFPRFFRDRDLAEGEKVMTAFLERVRAMLDRAGKQRGKRLALSVRVPETLARCRKAGLDIARWDALGLVDMVNVSSFYFQTMELGIEEFKAAAPRARIYGEMNYVTAQNSAVSKFARRYTTMPVYYAAALSLLRRGADGLSLFNYDYVPAPQRMALSKGLKGIVDVARLEAQPKDYVVTPNFGSLPATNEKSIRLFIADDTKKVKFTSAVLRVETKAPNAPLRIEASLNGRPLAPAERAEVELFPPLAANAGYPTRETVRFYAVPLDAVVMGVNAVGLRNLDRAKGSCTFQSIELALYR